MVIYIYMYIHKMAHYIYCAFVNPNYSIIQIRLDKYNKHVKFWDDVYGFTMECVKDDVLKEPNIETVPTVAIVTTPFVIIDIDLKTCQTNTVNFTSNFKLQVLKNGSITAFAGYFDIFFDLESKISFSTGPHSTRTHWQQTVFYIKKPIDIKEGDIVQGIFKCKRNKNVRGLQIVITVGKETQEYLLD